MPRNTIDMSPLERNSLHIAKFRVRENPKPLPDTQVTEAFGLRNYSKLVELLKSPKQIVRHKTVRVIIDLSKKPQGIVSFVNSGAVEGLTDILTDEDPVIRENALVALVTLCANITAFKRILANKSIFEVMARTGESEPPEVREKAYLCLAQITLQREGAAQGLEHKLVPLLLKKAPEERNNVNVLAMLLETLYNCYKEFPDDATFEEGIKVLTDLLNHENPSILEKVARCLTPLTLPTAGKLFAVESGTVDGLVQLLKHVVSEVKSSAAGSLMNITIENKGKWKALDCGITTSLIDLLLYPDDLVKLNVMKTMANVTEEPSGRHKMQGALPALQQLIDTDGNPVIVKHAQTAADLLTWIP